MAFDGRRRAWRDRYAAGLLGRLALVLAALCGVAAALTTPGLGAARVVTLLGAAAAVWQLWRYVRRTNRELARFVDAVRHGDLSQHFGSGGDGSGFAEVGAALDAGIRRLRDERRQSAEASRFYEAVLDASPVALLTVADDGRVELANQAARRVFTRHAGVRGADFGVYGETFARALDALQPGRSRLLPLVLDAEPHTALVGAAAVHRLGGRVRVVAVQPIQGELNAVEIAAQSDLVRVLTHEIMNSMTPVTSLARSAAGLIAEADAGGDARIAAARAAVETLARRADGVMHFVDSYRAVSRIPEVRRRSFEALPWARELQAVALASGFGHGVEIGVAAEPPALAVDADPDLLGQVLLNLLKNGAEAAAAHAAAPRVEVAFHRAGGGRTRIDVADNGPGVPPALRQDVFLPFFTTKPHGTGIGLNLARQIVLAHDGSIRIDDRDGGGALVRLVL